MCAEQTAIEGEALRLRRDQRTLHFRVTILLVYVSLILVCATSCGYFEWPEEHGVALSAVDPTGRVSMPIAAASPVRGVPDRRPARSATGSGFVPPAYASNRPGGSALRGASVSFTLPSGGALVIVAPAGLSDEDADFAAVVVGDYLTALAVRGTLQR